MFEVSVGLTIARYSENINNTEDTFFFQISSPESQSNYCKHFPFINRILGTEAMYKRSCKLIYKDSEFMVEVVKMKL